MYAIKMTAPSGEVYWAAPSERGCVPTWEQQRGLWYNYARACALLEYARKLHEQHGYSLKIEEV